MAKVGTFHVAGKQVACDHCGGREFRLRWGRWLGFPTNFSHDSALDLLFCTACTRSLSFQRGRAEYRG